MPISDLLDIPQRSLLETIRAEMRQPVQLRMLPGKLELVALIERMVNLCEVRYDEPLSHALHRVWDACRGAPGYDRFVWKSAVQQLAYVPEGERATLCSALGPGPGWCCTLVVAHDGHHHDDVLDVGWTHRPDRPGEDYPSYWELVAELRRFRSAPGVQALLSRIIPEDTGGGA